MGSLGTTIKNQMHFIFTSLTCKELAFQQSMGMVVTDFFYGLAPDWSPGFLVQKTLFVKKKVKNKSLT